MSLFSHPAGFLNPCPRALSFFLFSCSPRLQVRLWQNQTMTFGTLIPNDTIAILLGLVSLVQRHLCAWRAELIRVWADLGRRRGL